jgi:deazaflavin-dependent oxidoreductase (nitroreductase family)
MNATLTTTGRQSGESRTVKLYAWPDGDRFVLVGSWAGGPKDPAWAHNLRVEPRCSLRIGKEKSERSGRATEVEPGPEFDRLWALVVDAFRYYATYQRKTERRIPLFVFVPDDQSR